MRLRYLILLSGRFRCSLAGLALRVSLDQGRRSERRHHRTPGHVVVLLRGDREAPFREHDRGGPVPDRGGLEQIRSRRQGRGEVRGQVNLSFARSTRTAPPESNVVGLSRVRMRYRTVAWSSGVPETVVKRLTDASSPGTTPSNSSIDKSGTAGFTS